MKELECIRILHEGRKAYGGNQEWYHEYFQRLAGCGSVTGANMMAYYALHEDHCDQLWIERKDNPSSVDYLKLMNQVYNYMTPGVMGYPLVGRFVKDFKQYAKDRGVAFASKSLFLPKKKKQCLAFIKAGIDTANPVAFLILRHPAKELSEDNWHWVTIMGYDDKNEKLIWSNCGEREEIDWNMLFDEGVKHSIAMARFERIKG